MVLTFGCLTCLFDLAVYISYEIVFDYMETAGEIKFYYLGDKKIRVIQLRLLRFLVVSVM